SADAASRQRAAPNTGKLKSTSNSPEHVRTPYEIVEGVRHPVSELCAVAWFPFNAGRVLFARIRFPYSWVSSSSRHYDRRSEKAPCTCHRTLDSTLGPYLAALAVVAVVPCRTAGSAWRRTASVICKGEQACRDLRERPATDRSRRSLASTMWTRRRCTGLTSSNERATRSPSGARGAVTSSSRATP